MGTKGYTTVTSLDRVRACLAFRLHRHLVKSDIFRADAGREFQCFPEIEREYALERVVLARLVKDDHRLVMLGRPESGFI